jgi:excisionase family DNA binding protein
MGHAAAPAKENGRAAAVVVSGEWMISQEAERRLNIARRTLQEWTQKGFIRWKPNPDLRRERLYSAADVHKLAATGGPPRQAPAEPRARQMPGATFHAQHLLAAPDGEAGKPAELRLTEKLWLSLEEAAALTGFSVLFLTRKIADGTIAAVKGGPHGSWRIRRASLEAFEG